MDARFHAAAAAILTGALDVLEVELTEHPHLATDRSSRSHPTLLQLVACEGANVPDPVGAARVLINHGAATWGPMVAAAGCNSVAVLDYLIDSGADFDGVDVWTPLEEALYWVSPDTTALLVQRGAPIRSLAAAAGLGDVEEVRRLLDGGSLLPEAGPIRSPFPDTVPDELASDVQSIIDHAFVMAVNAGQAETARELHAAGARMNARPPGYHWHGTALHAAVWRGDAGLVSWLVTVGADPTVRDGMAHADAAGWATHHDHPELIPLLGL